MNKKLVVLAIFTIFLFSDGLWGDLKFVDTNDMDVIPDGCYNLDYGKVCVETQPNLIYVYGDKEAINNEI